MKRNILVQGNFDVLHPGHIRLLKFAKECGDRLIVAINADSAMTISVQIGEKHRLEMVRSLECVDEAFVTELTPVEVVTKYRPSVVVKGKEFESQINLELDELNVYGGKLIFGSGEFDIASEQLYRQSSDLDKGFSYKELGGYIQRHLIRETDFRSLFAKIAELNVGVIGDVIVDEYVQGNAVGLSQEDPTIVMTPSRTDIFLGGAAITAGHIRSIGAKQVSLFSVLGSDLQADYVRRSIQKYKVEHYFFVDESRPTPLKTRYRVEKQTLLRVNQVRHHQISSELQNNLFTEIEKKIVALDVLVFSDFNYGLLPQSLVDQICMLCQLHNVKVVADSQTSSQVGNISRYKNVFLMTPTEKEVRIALNNSDDGLVILAKKLCEESAPKNLVITLGGEGSFIHLPDLEGNNWKNDRLPAINNNAIDPAGAGDCYLATCSLFMAAGSSLWQASYVANIAAACQVDTLGNVPLQYELLQRSVARSLKC
ncbi:MAG: adenylyltransferase/cytidyltransferase family protein [Candidatus Scalindua sp.]|jgi:rfaE bifunctional protein kinase chain/domain|nr:adenylyltransferase/cytidyltransferase family protein [Candidatus Scalindua sp.]